MSFGFSIRPRTRTSIGAVLTATAVAVALSACGSDSSPTASSSSASPSSTAVTSKTVTLVTYDSFALSKKTLADFTKKTGITVKVLKNGDTGKVVNTAILTKNRPQGDVLFGIDNTFLSKALDAGIFEPYTSPGLADIDPKYVLDPDHRVTPVDHGDVCLNYDKTWFAAKKIAPPASFEDLAKPQYKDLLVVENPATSSPGLSFLLATVAKYGQDGWTDYWTSLKDNGVKVQPGWDEAYYGDFTAGGDKGKRPIVVSYASSPAAAFDYSEKKLTDSPTASVDSTCFSSIEFAGILAGAKHADAGRVLVDYLIGTEVQKDIPPNMYVYPVRTGTPLPESFTKYAKPVASPLTLDAATIDENREAWTRTWQQTVLG